MPQGENVHTEAAQAVPTARTAEGAPDALDPQPPVTVLKRIENRFPRGLIIRLIAYLFVGHLFAFFVYLLFVLGARNQ